MAGEDYVRGENLDIILDLLDEDTLDEMFDEEIVTAVEDVTSAKNNSGEFNCTACKRKFKTKGGLARHTKTKHDVSASNTNKFDESDILNLVKDSQTDLYQNECYPKVLRETILQHKFTLSEPLKNELINSYAILSESGDGEKFFTSFYGKIIGFGDTLMPDLPQPLSTLLLKRLADKIFSFFRRPEQLAQGMPQSISNTEFGGLQYLSGYVVCKFLTKARSSPKYMSEVNQAIIGVLQNFIMEEHAAQRLIETQSRGGLTAVKPEIQNIFRHAEEKFNCETSNNIVLKIDTKAMANNLMLNTQIISLYNNLVENSGVEIDSEVKDNLLENMLRLYLRVRAFSFAKDVTNKHKVSLKRKKSRGLRKDIKKAIDKPKID